MKLISTVTIGFALLLTAAPAFAVLSAQDTTISVSPVVLHYPPTGIGTNSAPALFTITNSGGTPLSIGTIGLSGTNASEFVLATNSCPASLAAGGSCTVGVSFAPDSKGTKGANLLINSNASATPVLSAYLTNATSAAVAAQHRMPPVLEAISIPDTMTAGTTYTLTWTLEGYNDTYNSMVALFDCTGISDGSCGYIYGDATRIASSGTTAPIATGPGNWSYNGTTTQLFSYSWDFTVPANRPLGGTWEASPGSNVVVRFYQLSDIDKSRSSASMSLLIPGNQSSSYYDTAGRRIVKKIVAAPL